MPYHDPDDLPNFREWADDPANAALSRDEEDRFRGRWLQELAADPLYNRNLTLSGRAYDLAWPPRRRI